MDRIGVDIIVRGPADATELVSGHSWVPGILQESSGMCTFEFEGV